MIEIGSQLIKSGTLISDPLAHIAYQFSIMKI
jgi:hypothetical protein